MLQLILMRGLPGSGKTTIAKRIAEEKNAEIISTDDYWICPDGQYRFDPDRLDDAHQWNIKRAELLLKKGQSVIIDNCNAKNEHMAPYIELGNKFKAKINKVLAPNNDASVDDLFYLNTHNVPFHIIERMRAEWED